ncbi:YybH family protein [Streptomyces sioyaensis]|uniref:YybH family protein n=1 Tax=Streptomyces sioyaensis TaxID=67364 RepID=UPI0036B0B739
MTAVREKAAAPEDLARLFVERANAGDLEGLVELYEPDATVALPGGRTVAGQAAIRAAYEQMLARKPEFGAGTALPTLVSGDWAQTASRTDDGGARAEVAHRQSDGSWLIVLDRPFFA